MWGSDRGLEISKQFLVFLLCILPLIDTWLIICWLIKIIKTAKQKSAELYGDDKNDKLLISSCQLWSRGAEAATTRNFFDWEEKFWKSFRSVTRRYRHIPLPDQLGAEQDWDLCYHLLTKCDKQTHFKWYTNNVLNSLEPKQIWPHVKQATLLYDTCLLCIRTVVLPSL